MNANQVFNWLKEPRFAAEAEEEPVTRFLPAKFWKLSLLLPRRMPVRRSRWSLPAATG
ncbi:hypothetical protein [Leisingera caerulea]|uniref:hypothetical protein n=1 Tax=Leisingera caerulea TaxID=506591 RepID=UPI000411B712|nr:hypothetical protein [Leisingera caerulea]